MLGLPFGLAAWLQFQRFKKYLFFARTHALSHAHIYDTPLLKDVPVPPAWKLENADKPFVLEIEAGADMWNFKVNGEPQPDLAYVRTGDFKVPLIVQAYDLLNPRISTLRLE